MNSKKQIGFTLIELVAVIVILGVLAIATSKFIVFGTEIYIQATDRQHVLSKSRFLVERITRELRESIPGSIQPNSSGSCIRFIPIKGSGAYRTDSAAVTPPFAPKSGTQLDVVSWNGSYSPGDFIYIYAANFNAVYAPSQSFAVIDSISGSGPEYRFTLNTSSTFAAESPKKRYYTGNKVIIYCIYNGNAYRYVRNAINSFYPPPIFIANLGVLMSEGVTNDLATEPPFRFQEGALYRNSVVNLYLEFNANQDENMFFNQEVHIPNVP